MRSSASYCWNHNLLFRSIPVCLPSFPRMDSKLPQNGLKACSWFTFTASPCSSSKNQGRWCLRLILPSNMTGTMTFLGVQGSDENPIALVCSLWAAFRPYPPSQGCIIQVERSRRNTGDKPRQAVSNRAHIQGSKK